MDTAYGMTADSYRAYNKWHWIIGLILAALLFLLPWLFGIGPNSWRDCLPKAEPVADAPAVVPAPPPSVAAPAPAPVAAVPVEPLKPAAAVAAVPAARVFFALDRYALPDNVNQTLAEVVAYLKSHPGAKAVLSGFHDPQGQVTPAYNQQLASNRARSVQAALQQAGIGADRVVLDKPTESTGSGSYDEARRVEVTVRP